MGSGVGWCGYRHGDRREEEVWHVEQSEGGPWAAIKSRVSTIIIIIK